MIHIGKEIKVKVAERNISLGDFAKAIKRSRPLVYDIFERESIDTALLQKISEVLDYNFFSLFIPPQEVTIENTNLEDLHEQLKTTKQSLEIVKLENAYLKRINALLEEKNK